MAMLPASAQITLVKDGQPKSRIVVNSDSKIDRRAANLMQMFVERISGAKLPIVKSKSKKRGDIIIGEGSTKGLTEDGYRLKQSWGKLYVSSGGDKGTLNGVAQLLEDYLGVKYYSTNFYTLDKRSTVKLPKLNVKRNPVFRYRQSQCYALREDSVYRMFTKLEEHPDEFVASLWVHTFSKLLPEKPYANTHPEFYAMINGQRVPGGESQWCLTNPELFEVVAHRIDSIFKAHPERIMMSVSQNDGNAGACQCPECKKLEEYEGATSGPYIHFLNKLAERFPDKKFSTLAYYFTLQPPKHVKPLPNVNVMVCAIGATREAPLTETKSGREFVEALEGWSAISNNLFVWDYGINFTDYLSPFPNFPVLAENMQLFEKHHAQMHFQNNGGEKGSDFPEMRAYIVSKLMWDTHLDVDATMREFMDGYYGPASPYIYEYEKTLERELVKSGRPLLIYDTPTSHKNGMLNAENRKRYNELFDKAEAAVANDSAYLAHVRMARLPLMYSDLEIDKGVDKPDFARLRKDIKLFDERTALYGVKMLNEAGNKPHDYCELYKSRNVGTDVPSKALGAKVTYLVNPNGDFGPRPGSLLTDGKFSGLSYKDNWVGWIGKDGEVIIDLGEEKDIRSIETDCLRHRGAWVFLPTRIDYDISLDGENYTSFGYKVQPEDRATPIKFVKMTVTKPQPVKARYIKVKVTSIKRCPEWHAAAGKECWTLIDEISVY